MAPYEPGPKAQKDKEPSLMAELRINGWMVAEADLEHGYQPYNGLDRVCVFRNPTGWSTVSIGRHVRYDDSDRPVSGTATVTTSEFATLQDLADHIDKGYRAGAWVDLLDAGHENDADLYAAWVPERMRRDLDKASVFNRDLAYSAGYFDPNQLDDCGEIYARLAAGGDTTRPALRPLADADDDE